MLHLARATVISATCETTYSLFLATAGVVARLIREIVDAALRTDPARLATDDLLDLIVRGSDFAYFTGFDGAFSSAVHDGAMTRDAAVNS
jgi:hypothetical protein